MVSSSAERPQGGGSQGSGQPAAEVHCAASRLVEAAGARGQALLPRPGSILALRLRAGPGAHVLAVEWCHGPTGSRAGDQGSENCLLGQTLCCEVPRALGSSGERMGLAEPLEASMGPQREGEAQGESEGPQEMEGDHH